MAGEYNVRNANSHDAKDVAELAELIYSQSLLSALHVVPQLIDGRESGSYEVVAGGRRLRALQLLASQKRIAEALSLDMADWWEATPDTFLQAVPKAELMEAVTEAVDVKASEPIAAMKKEAAVAAAAARLHGTRWLPKPLRRKQREEAAAE